MKYSGRRSQLQCYLAIEAMQLGAHGILHSREPESPSEVACHGHLSSYFS